MSRRKKHGELSVLLQGMKQSGKQLEIRDGVGLSNVGTVWAIAALQLGSSVEAWRPLQTPACSAVIVPSAAMAVAFTGTADQLLCCCMLRLCNGGAPQHWASYEPQHVWPRFFCTLV